MTDYREREAHSNKTLRCTKPEVFTTYVALPVSSAWRIIWSKKWGGLYTSTPTLRLHRGLTRKNVANPRVSMLSTNTLKNAPWTHQVNSRALTVWLYSKSLTQNVELLVPRRVVSLQRATINDSFWMWAGKENRTPIWALARLCNSRYTIPASWPIS